MIIGESLDIKRPILVKCERGSQQALNARRQGSVEAITKATCHIRYENIWEVALFSPGSDTNSVALTRIIHAIYKLRRLN